MIELDPFDWKILTCLTDNARAPVNEIAERVALSASAVSRRIQRLEEQGVIAGYTARLDGEAIGLPLIIFVEVRLRTLGDDEFEEFERVIQSIPSVTDCFLMSGNVDYLLRMRARDMAHFEQLHRNELAKLPGVERLTTRFGMREIQTSSSVYVR